MKNAKSHEIKRRRITYNEVKSVLAHICNKLGFQFRKISRNATVITSNKSMFLTGDTRRTALSVRKLASKQNLSVSVRSVKNLTA